MYIRVSGFKTKAGIKIGYFKFLKKHIFCFLFFVSFISLEDLLLYIMEISCASTVLYSYFILYLTDFQSLRKNFLKGAVCESLKIKTD